MAVENAARQAAFRRRGTAARAALKRGNSDLREGIELAAAARFQAEVDEHPATVEAQTKALAALWRAYDLTVRADP
jgi:hypothetical protein